MREWKSKVNKAAFESLVRSENCTCESLASEISRCNQLVMEYNWPSNSRSIVVLRKASFYTRVDHQDIEIMSRLAWLCAYICTYYMARYVRKFYSKMYIRSGSFLFSFIILIKKYGSYERNRNVSDLIYFVWRGEHDSRIYFIIDGVFFFLLFLNEITQLTLLFKWKLGYFLF